MNEPGNLLGGESSPYLLQHAGNPVHWRPWGAAALAEAARRGRPILLSIGYAACHWCHVMAHESFEDEETARQINEFFVAVKVDREERPDIDHIYMSALHAMGEPGGWPLTLFLTPSGTPFWGGTYFPPVPRWGRPSFRQVLAAVADAWAREGERIAADGAAFRRLLAGLAATAPGGAIEGGTLAAVAARLVSAMDPVQGGFRGAPRFPNPPVFRFLWQEAHRSADAAAAEAVRCLLRGMSMGGIYDHLGGGYARYSTDAEWLVPHFEKMLYDNAQILELLTFVQADAASDLTRARAEETVGWLASVMATAPDAAGDRAFAAAEDADSEGEEGKFYVWDPAEIAAVLGTEAAFFARFYELGAHGNWEGRIVLRRIAPLAAPEEERRLAAARAALFAHRALRPRPARDDKVLADWNGLAILALSRASAVFDRPDWRALAESAFRFVRAALGGADGRVAHAWRLGRVSARGLLDDQAAMARAALALFQATGDGFYLEEARGLVAATERWFAAPSGAFFSEPADAADLPLGPAARTLSAACGVTPAGNGMMAEVLAALWHLTGEEAFAARAGAVIGAFSGAREGLAGCPTLLAAADLLENATIVVVAGDSDAAGRAALLAAARAAADPAALVVPLVPATVLAPAHPAFGKHSAGPAAFVCRGGVCAPPVGDPAALRALLRRPAAVLPVAPAAAVGAERGGGV